MQKYIPRPNFTYNDIFPIWKSLLRNIKLTFPFPAQSTVYDDTRYVQDKIIKPTVKHNVIESLLNLTEIKNGTYTAVKQFFDETKEQPAGYLLL